MTGSTAKMVVQIVARIGKAEVMLGEVEVDAKVSNGRARLPSDRDIRAAVRKSLR